MTGASSTGLGGAKNLRGVRRNRVVGDGYILGNIELRYKFAKFKMIRQNFYLAANTFVDFGQVTRKIDTSNRHLPADVVASDYFNKGAEQLHTSYGAGLRLVMNYNFVIAMDYGIATNKQDGDSGIYIGLNYLF